LMHELLVGSQPPNAKPFHCQRVIAVGHISRGTISAGFWYDPAGSLRGSGLEPPHNTATPT